MGSNWRRIAKVHTRVLCGPWTGIVTKHRLLSWKLEGFHGECPSNFEGILTIPRIPVKPSVYPVNIDTPKYPHLQDAHLPSIPSSEVDLVIGTDVPYFTHSEASLGAINLRYPLNLTRQTDFIDTSADLLAKSLNNLWDEKLYFKGINLNVKRPLSREDVYTSDLLKKKVRLVNDRYELTPLWKPDKPALSENDCVVVKRLGQLRNLLTMSNWKLFNRDEKVPRRGFCRKSSF